MDFHKVEFPGLKSLSLVDVTALVSLALLVVTHLPAALESHLIRQQVAAALPLAANAQAIVESNARRGRALDSAWVPVVLDKQVSIEVAASTGIVTVTFAWIAFGGKSLKLVPMLEVDEELRPLGQADTTGYSSPPKIVWICTSANARSRNTYILANRGTLESKYAPDACRHRVAGANKL
ncbi:MAG: pilin [Burkholderiaceae bacterium]|nr:pilin [Burkholderiaceae bacterium]